MIRPDYRYIKSKRYNILAHSAKGSTWKEHKYIKRKNGTYYYPDNYEGGRHLPDGEESDTVDTSGGEDSDEETGDKLDLTEEDIERLAIEVIRGNFGSGQERRDLLGGNYQEIQDRVNEILLGPSGEKDVQDLDDVPDEAKEKLEKTIKKVESVTVNSHSWGKARVDTQTESNAESKKGKTHSGSDINKSKGIDIKKRR